MVQSESLFYHSRRGANTRHFHPSGTVHNPVIQKSLLFISVRVHTYVLVHVRVRVHVHIHNHVHLHVNIHVRVRQLVHIHISMFMYSALYIVRDHAHKNGKKLTWT
jgi:hypothetical protein